MAEELSTPEFLVILLMQKKSWGPGMANMSLTWWLWVLEATLLEELYEGLVLGTL